MNRVKYLKAFSESTQGFSKFCSSAERLLVGLPVSFLSPLADLSKRECHVERQSSRDPRLNFVSTNYLVLVRHQQGPV